MREQSNTISIFGDDDYCRLNDLYLPLSSSPSSPSPSPSPSSPDNQSFTVCLWIYLVKNSAPGLLLRMVS